MRPSTAPQMEADRLHANQKTIDSGLVEAALIDGANRWKQTWYVILAGTRQMQIGYAMAVSLFKAAVGLSLVLLSNWIAKKNKEEGVFEP